jgi:hypothetical protein
MDSSAKRNFSINRGLGGACGYAARTPLSPVY